MDKRTTKRVICVGNADDVRRTGGTPIWEVENNDYVKGKYSDTDDEWGGLLWSEVRKIVRRAKLSLHQSAVFDGFIKGKTDKEIAQDLDITPQAVATHKERAFKKLQAVPDKGIITMMLENFGARAVRESR